MDTRPLSYPLTGIGVYVKHLLKALQEHDAVNNYLLISNGPIKFQINNYHWCKYEGRITQKLLSTLWMQIFAPWAAIKHGIDLFWSPRHHLPMGLPPTIPCVLTIHDLTYRFYPETMARANLWVERLLMPGSARRARKVITDAQSTANDLITDMGISSDRIEVVPPGPPLLTDPAGGNQAESYPLLPQRYFLFVGTLDPRKNFKGLFEAFVGLEPENNDLHLVIVGGAGWKNEDFHSQIENHCLGNRIHFTGYVARARLQTIYQNAIALVFPSFYEGFGFPILEAMAAGVPVITANVSSLPEVAGDAAILVDPHNTKALSRAMRRVQNSESLRTEMIARGKRQYAGFSWGRAAEQMMDIFHRVGRN